MDTKKPLDILLVEDSMEDVDLTEEVLNEQKVANRLNVIDNGDDALLYLKRQGPYKDSSVPDVIVLDLNIPRKDGFEVLMEIRKDKELQEIPIIILTTSDLSEEILKKYNLNLNQYVRKSVNFHEFVEAIRLVEHRRKLQTPLPPSPKDTERKLKILLVEDEQADANLVEDMLFMKEKYHWTIKHVTRLQEALKSLGEETFDVVVLDLFLPDAGGLDTLKKFMEGNKFPKLPIVVTTGLKDGEIGKQALRNGAQDYLIKGQITGDLFVRTVEYAIERKDLERLKDEFISYVNHELSNPLAVIKEGISQVSEGLLGTINDQQKHYLERTIANVNRLIRITEDLLDSTKLELGKLSLQKERFNFVELVEQVVESFTPEAKLKKIDIQVVLPSQAIEVYADKSRIDQVLTNLLNNALKYTSEGWIKIALSDTRKAIECTVTDTGVGIHSDDLPKLFSKFEQGHSEKSNNHKGTGLGLYICKQLIELHDGTIRAESQPGKGTKFIFSIPKGERREEK